MGKRAVLVGGFFGVWSLFMPWYSLMGFEMGLTDLLREVPYQNIVYATYAVIAMILVGVVASIVSSITRLYVRVGSAVLATIMFFGAITVFIASWYMTCGARCVYHGGELYTGVTIQGPMLCGIAGVLALTNTEIA